MALLSWRAKPDPNIGDVEVTRHFAWWPTEMTIPKRKVIWLGRYWARWEFMCQGDYPSRWHLKAMSESLDDVQPVPSELLRLVAKDGSEP